MPHEDGQAQIDDCQPDSQRRQKYPLSSGEDHLSKTNLILTCHFVMVVFNTD